MLSFAHHSPARSICELPMKIWLGLFCAFCFVISSSPAYAASANEEARLIRVLQSDAGPADKDAACSRLKRIGTQRCVPALAALLTDPQLSHSARYALESMDLDQASTALLQALFTTKGLERIGIIDSLGAKREPRALRPLATLLDDEDPAEAAAAARALGQIGGEAAAKILLPHAAPGSGPLHRATIDGLLRCANGLLATRNNSQARELFQTIYDEEGADSTRLAAYRGLMLVSGAHGLDLMLDALAGPPAPAQLAALQLVPNFSVGGTTAALCELLPRLAPPLQLALVNGLVQRGDASAAPALARFASTAAPSVRPAVLLGLGTLGNAATAPELCEFATSVVPEEQRAARRALLLLHRGHVTQALLDYLPVVLPAVQTEIVTALAERSDRRAVPRLITLASDKAPNVRAAAFRGLGLLADQPQLETLVAFVVHASDSTNRQWAADALEVAYQHLVARGEQVDARPLSAGLAARSTDARLALLPICSELVSPVLRVALRRALEDSNPRIVDAAFRAMCNSIDTGLLDDLVYAAHVTTNQTAHGLAIAGAVRMTGETEPERLNDQRRVAVLSDLLQTAKTPEEKRRILSGLAEVPGVDALRAAAPALDDGQVQPEAAEAVLRIAATLPGAQAQEGLMALNKALAGAHQGPLQQELRKAINQIEATADYITEWQVAGPYRQPGQNYHALFDVVFPPELTDAKGVEWKYLRPGTDPKRPWVMDLQKALGEQQQCVAYARTWVQADKDTTAQLELGSDDGVRAWLNDKQVFALNATRALTPGSDKVPVSLHSGWNSLLLKITQNNQGWEFCARFRTIDGSHLEGVKCDTSRTEAAAN